MLGGKRFDWLTMIYTFFFKNQPLIQSGAALFDMNPVQESPYVNNNIRDFHRLLFCDGSSSSKTIDQIIEDMKTVEAKKLIAAWNALWITDTDKYQGWYTVKEDGVFYTENAREKMGGWKC